MLIMYDHLFCNIPPCERIPPPFPDTGCHKASHRQERCQKPHLIYIRTLCRAHIHKNMLSLSKKMRGGGSIRKKLAINLLACNHSTG
jgi:hypothetical protein